MLKNDSLKKKKLLQIAREIENCAICKKTGIGKAVPGEGNPNARIIFVGEAPGRKESETGRPFIGRSGILLRKLIKEMGLSEEDVYITSPVKYLPKKGTPSKSEIMHGKIHFDKQVHVINPKILVLLGATACKAVLPAPMAINKMHGRQISQDGKMYFITFHPAAGLRFPPLKKLLEEDFKTLKKLL